MRLELNIPESTQTQDNFRNIEKSWNGSPIVNGTWQAFEKSLPVGDHTIYHKLGFLPKDVIQTSLTGTGSVVFNYSSFTENTIELTVSTADVTVRFLAGRVG